jgi:hypothetical protein
MANLYKPDGTVSTVTPKRAKWSLSELQELVEGDIEMMPGIKTRVIFNELGAIKSLPINQKATYFVQQMLVTKVAGDMTKLRYLPVLRGNVVILTIGEKM